MSEKLEMCDFQLEFSPTPRVNCNPKVDPNGPMAAVIDRKRELGLMNQLAPRIRYTDSVSTTDAVVGVSVDQTEVVEDWSNDLLPRAASLDSPIWRPTSTSSALERAWNDGGGGGEWAEVEDEEGVVTERTEVKGSGDAVELTPMTTTEDVMGM